MEATTSAEKITLGFGIVGISPLISAIVTLRDEATGVEDVASIFMVFAHILIISAGLPFLIKSTTQESMANWFIHVISAIAVINAILMIIIVFSLPDPNNTAFVVFGGLAMVELIPLLLLRRNRSN